MPKTNSPSDVFINCPFDEEFAEGFRALIFSVIACGFRVRCSRQIQDGSQTRIDKLYNIIEQCRFAVHDISRTELDKVNGLPRFNMPLELGIFLGAKRFGGDAHKTKQALVLDTEPHRYQKYISDLAGIDPEPHGGVPRNMVICVRDWLVSASRRKKIPGTQIVLRSYDAFTAGLPDITAAAGLDTARIAYPDFERLVIAWVREWRDYEATT